MTNLLNIIDKIYGSEYFTTILIASIAILIILFLLVLFIGFIDAKKEEIKNTKIEEEKDITFNEIKEEDNIKEDVTFEFPTITKNLEDFKISLEEEINKEADMVLPLEKSQRPYKVLEMSELEDTVILPKIDKDELEKTLMLPKMNLEEVATKNEINVSKEQIPDQKSDYLKQNIFSSAK